RPAVPELLGVGARPRCRVHRGGETGGEVLDLAGGRAQTLGVLAHLSGVHPPEGAHRAPPVAVHSAAKRRPCSRIGRSVPSTSPPPTERTSSAGVLGRSIRYMPRRPVTHRRDQDTGCSVTRLRGSWRVRESERRGPVAVSASRRGSSRSGRVAKASSAGTPSARAACARRFCSGV